MARLEGELATPLPRPSLQTCAPCPSMFVLNLTRVRRATRPADEPNPSTSTRASTRATRRWRCLLTSSTASRRCCSRWRTTRGRGEGAPLRNGAAARWPRWPLRAHAWPRAKNGAMAGLWLAGTVAGCSDAFVLLLRRVFCGPGHLVMLRTRRAPRCNVCEILRVEGAADLSCRKIMM